MLDGLVENDNISSFSLVTLVYKGSLRDVSDAYQLHQAKYLFQTSIVLESRQTLKHYLQLYLPPHPIHHEIFIRRLPFTDPGSRHRGSSPSRSGKEKSLERPYQRKFGRKRSQKSSGDGLLIAFSLGSWSMDRIITKLTIVEKKLTPAMTFTSPLNVAST